MTLPLRRRRAAAAALTLAALVPGLSACAPTVHLQPAAAADSVGCADLIVRLPSSLESLPLRETDAQGTAAWGSPAAALLRCGVATPQVSELACYTIDGVDWLAEPLRAGAQSAVYFTYGRTPGVQVVLDTKVGTNPLFDLASSIKSIRAARHCQATGDAPGGEPAAGSPSD